MRPPATSHRRTRTPPRQWRRDGWFVVVLGCAIIGAACGGDDGLATAPGPPMSAIASATSTSSSATTAATTSTVPPPVAADPTPTTVTDGNQALGDLSGYVVVLDPGHNGANWRHPNEISRHVDIGTGSKECDTTGTQSHGGLPESALNWDVVSRLRALLEGAGAEVVLTRQDDAGWGPCIDERARIGNQNGGHVAVSIHADGGPDDGRGFHIIHPTSIPGLTDGIADESEALARALDATYLRGTGVPPADYIGEGGYSQRGDLGSLNLSTIPKVFVEMGNMRNPTDAALFDDDGFRTVAATAIAEGIADFLHRRPLD
jgi:N-acetylmuramoyl-L-alanine amidase